MPPVRCLGSSGGREGAPGWRPGGVLGWIHWLVSTAGQTWPHLLHGAQPAICLDLPCGGKACPVSERPFNE